MMKPAMTGRDMPWGWWLRAEGRRLVDEDGSSWLTVRDAYWRGRLGFPTDRGEDGQQELLLRVLTAVDARFVGEAEGRQDLFDGDMMFWHFFMCWLVSIGLTSMEGGELPCEASLTEEGRAVMLMLRATRDPAWAELPMKNVIESIRTQGLGAAESARERELVSFETEAMHLPWVFARRRLGPSFVITLTGLTHDSRMPTKRMIWTQSFSDEVVRDDFFAWMAERVDRWEDWGRLAYEKGAGDLTRHLLALSAAAHRGPS